MLVSRWTAVPFWAYNLEAVRFLTAQPLTDAELAALKKQINSPLLERFLRTIEAKDQLLSEKDAEIAKLSKKENRLSR